MDKIRFEKTGNEKIPVIAYVGEKSTPVWLQQLWEDGPDAFYIRRNGCGHCCAAMAMRLCGVSDMDPAREYEKCIELWGQLDEENGQDHFQTAKGIVHILGEYGVKAEAKGVPSVHAAAADILTALKNGSFVIFWSSPKEGVYNPFSMNEHYVMAVGFNDEAETQIVILNSGSSCTTVGEQLTDIGTIEQALFEGAAPSLSEWGYDDRLPECGGYVIVRP